MWAAEILRTSHTLVYYIWVVGAVLVGAFMAIAYYFFTWWNEHRDIIQSIGSWQDAVHRSEQLVIEAAERLPIDVWLDFRDPSVLGRFRQAIDGLMPTISPEEIDIQIANTAVLIDVPADVFRRLGNYFRFRAELARQRGASENRARDLWYAVRRYERARDRALEEGGRRGRSVYGHASLGIAICLILLERNRDAMNYAREAADRLGAELTISDAVPALVTYALTLKRNGEFQEATVAFEAALSRAPFNVYANYNAACCWARWGDDAPSAEVRQGRYLRALAAIETIVGRVGIDGHVVMGIENDTDFKGVLQHPDLQPRFADAVRRLKESG